MKPKACRLSVVLAAAFLLSACSGHVSGVPEPRPGSASSIEVGRRLIASYGCGACHSIPGVPGAEAQVAPPLGRFYERSFIAGRLSNSEANLVQWSQDPQESEPGTAMPDLGVSEGEAQAMAAYLYRKPAMTDLLNR